MYKRVVREWWCMRQEDRLNVAEMKMLRFSLGVTWMDGIGPSKSEGYSMFWRQRPGWDGWDWRTTANLSVEGWNLRWSCQAGGLEEDRRGDLWIYGCSKAVRTPEGNSWKEETVIFSYKNSFYHIIMNSSQTYHWTLLTAINTAPLVIFSSISYDNFVKNILTLI